MRRFLRYHGLSITLMALFISLWCGQAYTGWRVSLEQREEDGEAPVSFVQYLRSGHFLEATAENWESEFLQMGAFLWLTAFLHQKGSPESNDPDRPTPQRPVTADSPWPARAGGCIKGLFAYSLTLAFGVMFLTSWALHLIGGTAEFNRERIAHGEPALSTAEFLQTSQFWFQSLQNWQSEFLAIAAMVYLAVFLRHKGSPESKQIATPTWENDD